MRPVTDRLYLSWKFLGSFLKRDWTLEDYPVRVEYFPDVLKHWAFDGEPLRAELHPNVIDRQLRSPPWSGTWLAHVVNWPR